MTKWIAMVATLAVAGCSDPRCADLDDGGGGACGAGATDAGPECPMLGSREDVVDVIAAHAPRYSGDPEMAGSCVEDGDPAAEPNWMPESLILKLDDHAGYLGLNLENGSWPDTGGGLPYVLANYNSHTCTYEANECAFDIALDCEPTHPSAETPRFFGDQIHVELHVTSLTHPSSRHPWSGSLMITSDRCTVEYSGARVGMRILML